nr:U3 small nucleolar ribonucleoprotein IMP4 [Andalucia godoyi]
MQRRLVRQRKEYLYKKQQEQEHRSLLEKKTKLKSALENSRPIPSELKKEERSLRRLIRLDDPDQENNSESLLNAGKRSVSKLDDEYALAGIEDPRVLITTCRDPSSRLQQFAKEVRLLFPNAQRINRGNYVVKELMDDCRSRNISDLVILHEHRGEPDGLIVCHMPFGPTAFFSMSNVVMRHDIPDVGPVSEQFPHLIFNGFSTPLGQRVTTILKSLFPVPKTEASRVVTFANQEDVITFRHHLYEQEGKGIKLKEMGPRFDIRLYQIRLGTLEMQHAQVEWVLRPYMNTAKKRKAL